MSRKHYLALAISTAIAMAGCSQAPEETNTAETESTAQTEVADTTPQAAPEIGSWGFDLTGMNTEVHPGNDFNKYANGQWLDTKEIPSDRARWGIFDKLRERSTEQVNVIIDDHDFTNFVVWIHTSRSITYEKTFNSQELHYSNWESYFLHRVAFVEMKTPLHRNNFFTA